MSYTFDPHALRLTKAQLAVRLSPMLQRLGAVIAILCLLGAGALGVTGHHQGFSLGGVALMLIVGLLWVKRDLNQLPPAAIGTSTALDQLLPIEIAAYYQPTLSGLQLWSLINRTAEANFILARFNLNPDHINEALANTNVDHQALMAEAERVTSALGHNHLTPGALLYALISLNPNLTAQLTALKLTSEDLAAGVDWIWRLQSYLKRPQPLYGGVARDWASGFTPLLNNFGTNLSQQVEYSSGNAQDYERTEQLDALVSGLDSANGSVTLIGEPGIGKTALLIGLADRLLQDQTSGSLAHHQIVSLNASLILSSAKGQGDLEDIVLQLFTEATHAGNIVIALDEAQLFFGHGPGAANLSQILLPILQARTLKLVLAITPGDWQRLRATNTAMASLLTPLVLSEPGEEQVIKLLADRALHLENGQFITTYTALLEAYRLSGRYFQEEAYPGRAFKLLEAALNYPDGSFITERSIQQAVENQFGVKVQQASTTETDALLHLEDKIHERMINQTRAVSVVANALRRARAGVANPRRPIGSFLFLGPTGVGKTELTKSLAALYFGAEKNVIRLDMSEYQQIPDVDRILQSAAENPESLLPKVRQQPFSVVLFDEIEKAHPNVLNLFLQLLDEGNLTDTSGHATSFKDAIVIATSNAGADEIRRHIEAGEELESFEDEFTNHLIDNGIFRPELLNRFDEIVLFRPLNPAELAQVVRLMIREVNRTLANQKISVELTDNAVAQLVGAGYDPRLGARPMRRMVQRRVEDAVAGKILRGEAQPGDIIQLDADHLSVPSSSGPAAV